jgi:2'-5' RNA ligase
MSNLRLFVALELEAAARRTLVAWQQSEVAALAGLRVVPARALHLTLRFLGDQPADAVPVLAAALGAGFGSGPCPLAVGDAIWLPTRRPRVLAAAVVDPEHRLAELAHVLERELGAGAELPAETGGFLPHVTVARVPRGGQVAAVALDGPEAIEFAGRRVVLLRSLLGAGPPRYEELYGVSL